MRVLLIEDEPELAASLLETLRETYAADRGATGQEGLKLAQNNEYDLIILDLGLPDISGLDVCRKLRQLEIKTPILILTGKFNTASDKALGLDCGADDYLTKPFHLEELAARVRALLRRAPEGLTANVLSAEDLSLDLAARTVSRGRKKIELRRKEFDLLEYLLRNRNRVVTRGMILEHVWDDQVDLFTNAIDVHIKYLRDKVDRPFNRKLIKTVHGLGYKLEDQERG